MDNEIEDVYVQEMSNSPSGVLVEMRLYGESHKLDWIIEKVSEGVLEKMKNQAGKQWVVYGNPREFDRAMRDAVRDAGGENGNRG